MISPKLMLPAALCGMMMLAACSTTPPTAALTSPTSAVKAVPCVEVPMIPYHAPTTASAVSAWLAGTLPDPKNAYDTPGTAAAVRRQNAARNAVCGP